ncbi:hypothetical protein HOT81_gp006 [Gordonia phage Fryberger]|uniref:Uncharacterized protein n=1 Tax=Gordonia phage Fryberger TaxID=2250392 RepID=A0A346FCG1_9CAUD|nr:hypothetical protein HOT81_gp006 [Gordonia phage Fryberger]AXN53425.1 hypothetical protein SEA_FRYBERGER_6 [Gordonia phage Fryberger]QTF81794.1 membrane protein [Gordonia phage Guey18]
MNEWLGVIAGLCIIVGFAYLTWFIIALFANALGVSVWLL